VPYLTLYGQVETPNLFKAASPGTARVMQVLVREGQRVAKGQLLATLDRRDFVPRLEQARADVAELEAQIRSENIRHQADLTALKQDEKLLSLARDGVERARSMRRRKLGSESSLDDAERSLATQALALSNRKRDIADHPARLEVLQARLQKARAGVAELQLQLQRSEIRAPYDAIVAKVAVTAGDQVKDNTTLLTLYDPADLEVRSRVPAPYQAELQRALAGGHTLKASARLGSSRIELHLARLAGEADPSGSDVLFHIDRGAQWLRTGQLLRFRLQRLPQPGTVAVPYRAVYGNDRIYALRDGRMKGLSVTPLGNIAGPDGDERLLVRAEGLRAGDRLVVTHLPNAVDGLKAESVAD
jgi:multidrug efflux pump subunit AcrA (membrane-fusion protein)